MTSPVPSVRSEIEEIAERFYRLPFEISRYEIYQSKYNYYVVAKLESVKWKLPILVLSKEDLSIMEAIDDKTNGEFLKDYKPFREPRHYWPKVNYFEEVKIGQVHGTDSWRLAMYLYRNKLRNKFRKPTLIYETPEGFIYVTADVVDNCWNESQATIVIANIEEETIKAIPITEVSSTELYVLLNGCMLIKHSKCEIKGLDKLKPYVH